jgi:hypothetical protein
MVSFHPTGLFLFYSTWALFVHVLFFSAPAFFPSSYSLAWLVALGGLSANILYIPMYNWKGNLLRIPYELIVHALPLAFFYVAGNEKHRTWSWFWPVALAVPYLVWFSVDAIVKNYRDPLLAVFY